MQRITQTTQLIAWLLVASYFAILISERISIKPVAKNDIVAQLEQQVNYSPNGDE